jgi:hypothetical protein
MRQLGFAEIIKAVYARLKTSAYTSTYVIYDFVSKAPVDFPYVYMGELVGRRSADWGSRDFDVEEDSLTVHVFSDSAWQHECDNMMKNVIKAITSTALTLDGYGTPSAVFFESADIIRDDTEGIILWHGIIRFRFIISS